MIDFPIPEQTQLLIQRLYEKTVDGRLVWEKGSADTEFVLTQDAGTVIISSKDGDGQPPFEIRILDPAGRVVERHDAPGGAYIRALYEVALKSTVRSSPVVDSLMKDLAADDD